MYFDAAVGMLDAHDQHVLGQPALAAAEIAGDTQAHAFLAQQRVAAVARSAAPDRVVLRKMQDQAAIDIEVSLAVQAAGEFAVRCRVAARPPRRRGS